MNVTDLVLPRRKLLPALGLALVAWLGGASTALAQPAPAGVPPGVAPADKLSQAAGSVGVKRCLPAINRLGNLAIQGSRNNDVLLDWDRQSPDTGPMFSLIGMEYPNGGVAASVTAVPDVSGPGCTVAAERITVAPFTCASIAQSELAGYQATRLLPIYAVYTDPKEPGSSVSLIDSPPGCMVIRRFVEYHWIDPGLSPSVNAPAHTASPQGANRQPARR